MKKRRILYLLFEGLPRTVIDSQVLMHARVAQTMLPVEFEVWTFAGTDGEYKLALARLAEAERIAQCPVRVLRGVRPAMPGSVLWHGYRLARALRIARATFDIIHARGDYAAAVAGPLARRAGMSVIWDCRGDAEAEFDERMRDAPFLMRPVLAWRRAGLKRDQRRAAQGCAAALFVSTPLAEQRKPLLQGKPYRVIPCVANDDMCGFDPILRRDKRRALGFTDGDTVFVYSGSLLRYQCFEETVDLFEALLARCSRARLLVLTHDTVSARQALARLPADRYALFSAALDEVNAYLNAADAAFMLREDTPVNRVASPTKFAEYCLCGLPVITGGAVRDSARLARSFGNFLPPDPDAVLAGLGIDRGAVAAAARRALSRRSVMHEYAALYGVS